MRDVLIAAMPYLAGLAALLTAVLSVPAIKKSRAAERKAAEIEGVKMSVSVLQTALVEARTDLSRTRQDRDDDRERFETRMSELEQKMDEQDRLCNKRITDLAEQVTGLGGTPRWTRM